MNKLTMEEVVEQFRKALHGEIKISLYDPNWNWDKMYAGNVGFWFGDYKIILFNDCDELDYTDSVVSPDGRYADYGDWNKEDFIGCPLNLLSEKELSSLEKILKEAK